MLTNLLINLQSLLARVSDKIFGATLRREIGILPFLGITVMIASEKVGGSPIVNAC